VRLVAPDGEQIGIRPTEQAMYIARELGLDLVEVAPMASPPVCRIMDYGKYKYEQAQKAKDSRKKQSHIVVKEIKMRPKIDRHDYETKKRHVVRFIEHGDKVKATIMFRGREMAHTELGARLLTRLADDVDEIGFVEAMPKLDGRNMAMVIAPHRDLEKRLAARREREEAGADGVAAPPGTEEVAAQEADELFDELAAIGAEPGQDAGEPEDDAAEAGGRARPGEATQEAPAPETVPETGMDGAPETVPETAPETLLETAPETLPKTPRRRAKKPEGQPAQASESKDT